MQKGHEKEILTIIVKEIQFDEEKEILTRIVKEIQFDRNMCDPNSYCFLPIEFSIQEIENVENFQIFGPVYKTN